AEAREAIPQEGLAGFGPAGPAHRDLGQLLSHGDLRQRIDSILPPNLIWRATEQHGGIRRKIKATRGDARLLYWAVWRGGGRGLSRLWGGARCAAGGARGGAEGGVAAPRRRTRAPPRPTPLD